MADNTSEEEIIKRAPKVGDFMLDRYAFYELPRGSVRQREAYERNAGLEAGDERVVWGVGCTF